MTQEYSVERQFDANKMIKNINRLFLLETRNVSILSILVKKTKKNLRVIKILELNQCLLSI